MAEGCGLKDMAYKHCKFEPQWFKQQKEYVEKKRAREEERACKVAASKEKQSKALHEVLGKTMWST